MLFRSQPIDYEGERVAEEIIKFIDDAVGPIALKLTAENITREISPVESIAILVSDNDDPINDFYSLTAYHVYR